MEQQKQIEQQECIEFDLQIALKQPERVAQRGTGKPVEWKYFEGRRAIVYVTEHGPYIEVPADKGNYCKGDLESGNDLVLLPEFTPEDGKWYWTQLHKGFDYRPTWFADGFFWVQGIKHNTSDFFHIHPEPIPEPIKMPE